MKKKGADKVRRSARNQGLNPSPVAVAKSSKKQKKKKVLQEEEHTSGLVADQVQDKGKDTEMSTEPENYEEAENVDQAEEEQPAGEQQNGEQATEEQPAEEQPTEEQPTEEQPTEEQPAGEQQNGEQPAEEQPAEEQPSEEQPSQPATTQESNTVKRNKRGLTKMRRVAKDPDDKVSVEFTDIGEHAGPGSVTLSSFLGPLVREHVPVLLEDWRKLDEETKDTLWEEIQGRFNLKEEWQKDSVFKQMGCLWRASKSRLVNKIRSTTSTSARLKMKPSNIQSISTWNSWVKSKCATDFKVRSDKYRELRRSQIPHTTSRKGMFRLAYEMKKKSDNPRLITRSKVWIAGHTHADGTPVRPEFAEKIEQIQSLDSQMESTANDNIKEDAVSQVLGKDKPGRVRGMGRGITATKIAFLQSRDSHVQKLEAIQTELLSKVEELNNKVLEMAAKKKQYDDMGSQSGLSDAGKVGPRCQLLDWFASEDVIVGEGEFYSAEQAYKIGRIPLGPNAAAVVVKTALVPEAFVWRPTPDVYSLDQAVGVKIAWPMDKILLDTDDYAKSSGSKNPGTSATSTDELHEKWSIFDWNADELVAEGVVCSTDPKEMINQIPLGPNAAILRIDKVIKDDAYLWRPSADMFLMGEAIHKNVAWPIHKIELVRKATTDASMRRPTTSASNSSGTSKNGMTKCILLDCNNSGETVAHGRIFSSDPAATVHHVPIGPNATKVWVDISKIDFAEVWRPNTEIKYIKDAIGSTVAWPSDKIMPL